MKRKLICLLLCVLMLVPSALAVDLYVDGKKLETDTEPTIVSGRTLVPVRAIFESLGAEVFWDAATWTVTATKGDTTITMSIGNTTAYVNGAKKKPGCSRPAHQQPYYGSCPLRLGGAGCQCSMGG